MGNENVSTQTFVRIFLLLGLLSIALLLGNVANAYEDADQSNPFYYISPRPGANYVPPGTSILLRSDRFSVSELLKANSFAVEGSKSGSHSGEAELASDGSTVAFRPHVPFTPGESVQIRIRLPEPASSLANSGEYTFAFSVTEASSTNPAVEFSEEFGQPLVLNQLQAVNDEPIPPFNFLTAPPDIPPIAVERRPGTLGDGYIFVSTFNRIGPGSDTGYTLILDNNGEPVYYSRPLQLPVTVDFKKQPNGLLTYFAPGPGINRFFGINENYEVVDEYMAGNGYVTDLHDLELLDNGHALLMIHDLQAVDMNELVPGGSTEAPVIGCVIQEVDEDNKVVFQWRSWDHIDILDTNRPLDDNPLRYIHCNSLMQDYDGNLLMSSRHLDEVTKIDRQTGEIIWRLGGRHNDFEFISDYGFSMQHDARRLSNGHLTVYDNGVAHEPPRSRGIEYVIDENNKVAVEVAEFRNTPETFAVSMGNMQTLANGNVVVGWGNSSAPMLTEFDRAGNKLLEFTIKEPFGTYRAFRFPWQGYPLWPPVLVAQLEENTVHLYFSWNGSTETTGYKVFGGRDRDQLTQMATVARSSFETTYTYELPAGDSTAGFWFFRVVPFNAMGEDGTPSNDAYVVPGGDHIFLPVVSPQVSIEP